MEPPIPVGVCSTPQNGVTSRRVNGTAAGEVRAAVRAGRVVKLLAGWDCWVRFPGVARMKRMWLVCVATSFVALGSLAFDGSVARASGGTISSGTYGFSCVGYSASSAAYNTSIDMPANPSYLQFEFKCAFRPFDSTDSNILTALAASTSSSALTGTQPSGAVSWGDGGGGSIISNNVATGNNVGNSGCNPSTKSSNGAWTMHHGAVKSHTGATIEAAETASMPDNVFYFRVRCSDNAGFGDQNNFRWTPSWSADFPGYVAINSTTHNNDCGMDYHTAGSTNQGQVPVCWGTSQTATWGTETTGVWPDHWAGQEASLPLPSCQEIGIGYEYREAGVDSEWVEAVDGEFPGLTFGDSIRWTMELPDSDLYESTVQIDHLAFVQIGRSPVRDTGDYPNYRNYELEPFSDQLIDPTNGSWPTDLTEQTLSGIGITWAIRPGDNLSQQVGPYTHTGTFLHLGESGSAPVFHVQCHVYGDGFPYEEMRMDGSSAAGGTSINSGTGCEETRVVWKSSLGTDTQWGYDVIKQASTTNAEELWWRYTSVDPFTPDAWVEVTPAGWPTSLAVGGTVLINRTDAPNPYLVEWKCVEAVAGGGTRDVESGTEPPGAGVGADRGEACYGRALDSMELTRPRTWVSGAGRMGVCLLEFLFVPGDEFMETTINAAVESTEDTLPFSMVYEAFAIFDTFFDAAEDADGGVVDTGMDCELLGTAGTEACAGSTIDTPDLLTGANRDIVWGVICLSLTMLALSFAWTMVHWDSGSTAEGKS